MLHVNDDRNDELFRRAAENYPLKTDDADWEAVRRKMEAAEDETPVIASGSFSAFFRVLLFLLLLIPLKIYDRKFVIEGDENNATGNVIPVTPTRNEGEVATINKPEQTMESNVVPADKPVAQGTAMHPQHNKRNNLLPSFSHAPVVVNDLSSTKRTKFTSKQKTSASIQAAVPENDDETTDEVDTKSVAGQDHKTNKQPLAAPHTDKESIEKEKEINEDKEIVKKNNDDKVQPVVKNDPKEKNKKRRHLYMGLVGGPDFSTIKMQSVKKTGFNYGFVVGYQLSNRLSIETGLTKAKKLYSTDGKYFNTKNIYLPGYSDIEYVTGECNMYEMPLNARYTFNQRKKSAMFASAGVSSYFMRSESYVYDINHYGVRYPKSASYNNKSTVWAAVVTVSAGYSYSLGKIADVRIEPYIKLPVNKIGTGSLPIQSAGVTIGITKTIF